MKETECPRPEEMEGEIMNIQVFLTSLTDEEKDELFSQLLQERADKAMERYEHLTPEERQMDRIEAIMSVKFRLNIGLKDARIFYETEIIKPDNER